MSTGYLCTEDGEERLFNKISPVPINEITFPDFFYFTLTKWIYNNEMTEVEKKEHPSFEITGGYLKVFDYKEAWRISWEDTTEEDRKKVLLIPNFDADIFEEISGIRVDFKKNKTIEIAGNIYKVKDIEKALSGIKPI